MIASKHTYDAATAEHRLDILRQEEIDRKIEEAEYPTGGHCIGGPTPASLIKPRHVGLTSAEEHATWLKDVSHWQGEYLAILADLERVHTFIIESGDALREHAATLAGMIAEHDAMSEEYEALKARHLRARATHEQAAEHHDEAMRRVRMIANEIREAFRSPRTAGCKHRSAKEAEPSYATT